jgi:hypothetical protein
LTKIEKSWKAIARAIDRELPLHEPTARRSLLRYIILETAVRLEEFDRGAEENRGIKPPHAGDPPIDSKPVLADPAVKCETPPVLNLDV